MSGYSGQRTPSWTDRILYATYPDSSDITDGSGITSLLYTSIPSYTTSDHVRRNLQTSFCSDIMTYFPETYCVTFTPSVFNPCTPAG